MATIDFENIESQNNSDNKYLELCKKGRYIEAVKVYKDDTGCGLAEAKAYIDNLRSEYGGTASICGTRMYGCGKYINYSFISNIFVIWHDDTETLGLKSPKRE